jgi:outer membrane protein OmpA-like peptidoglycan-associated protein
MSPTGEDRKPDGAARPRRWTDELRLWLAAAFIAALLAMLAGCQSAPPAAHTPAERDAALRSLGFVPAEDGWMLDLATPILFEVNRADLRPETREAIARMAVALRRIGVKRVRVEGHTDDVGTNGYNAELSLRRAEAVSRELATHGFPEEAIVRRGLGKEHPVAPNDSPGGRALNRRVAIMVLAADSPAE